MNLVGRSGRLERTECDQLLRIIVVIASAAHLAVQACAIFGAGEYAGEGVIVCGRDGIELVIVAARATDCEGQHRTADGVDLLVDVVHPVALFEPLIYVLWS